MFIDIKGNSFKKNGNHLSITFVTAPISDVHCDYGFSCKKDFYCVNLTESIENHSVTEVAHFFYLEYDLNNVSTSRSPKYHLH